MTKTQEEIYTGHSSFYDMHFELFSEKYMK